MINWNAIYWLIVIVACAILFLIGLKFIDAVRLKCNPGKVKNASWRSNGREEPLMFCALLLFFGCGIGLNILMLLSSIFIIVPEEIKKSEQVQDLIFLGWMWLCYAKAIIYIFIFTFFYVGSFVRIGKEPISSILKYFFGRSKDTFSKISNKKTTGVKDCANEQIGSSVLNLDVLKK